MSLSHDDQLERIMRGCTEIISREEMLAKLKLGRPLRIKAGFDPTAKDLHLGHTVLINKLKVFQDMGHEVIFLIGDFTAKIGDPSGRNSTRPPLTDDAIIENTKTYTDQVFKILDRGKTKVVYNSTWLKPMGAEGMIKLAARSTVARMLERDDFAKRFEENQPISIHEFLYPLLQGWDSVELKADVELGGNDQKFNLLMGRQLQRDEGQETQAILMMPLLEGTDGVRKMSKSYDNYIGIQDAPRDIFGKVLSITDELMWRYYELLSFQSLAEIAALKKAVADGLVHPKNAKVDLAKELVARFYNQEAAERAEAEFNEVFAKKGLPDDIGTFEIELPAGGVGILELLSKSGLVKSNSEARRLIEQGGVKIDQEKFTDAKAVFNNAGKYLVQAGKRQFKYIVLK